MTVLLSISCYVFNLKVQQFRFSISWSRIFPNGTEQADPDGINYYNNIINQLLGAQVQPVAVLYQTDLPQAFVDKGGWLNPDIAGWFEKYADFCFSTYGSRVSKFVYQYLKIMYLCRMLLTTADSRTKFASKMY